MDDFEGSYAPQSPDLSGLHDFDDPQPAFSTAYYHPQSQHQSPSSQQNFQQPPTSHSPYGFNQTSVHSPHHHQHYDQQASIPSNGRMRGPVDDDEYLPEPMSAKGTAGRKSKKTKVVEEEACEKPAPGVEEGIDVKTKFPVARIKRIMQADEDVGKVAQVTPTAVSKALELFMISIVTKAADTARSRSSKRVTAQHLKQALQNDEQFDFLADIIAKVPDAPSARKKEETEESEDAIESKPKKKKGATKRKKKDEDDEQ